jgi:hypothetical protein
MPIKSRFYRLDSQPKYTRKEIDLRSEVDTTFEGSVYEIPKSFLVLLRKFRRNSGGYKIPCACNVGKEGQYHQKCSVCLGEGYLWDEHYISTFKVEIGSDQEKVGASLLTEIGRTKRSFCKFYIQSTELIDYEDRIIEISLDREGKPLKPERRSVIWTINTLSEKRADNGKLEYTLIFCRRFNVSANE